MTGGINNGPAAIALAKRGLAVFACKAGAKVPATRNGFKDATRDLEVVAAFWNGCAYVI